MRHLILMRGAMGAGKTTFIQENNLQQYTLSADDIRLLFQTPVLNEDGNYTISGKNDKRVWDLLFQLLEERMKRGEFTVIDATHAKQSMISQYKKLASKYRYRVSVVDFSDVPLEKLMKQNRKRAEHKVVPEHAILNAHERMSTERVPKWVNVIKPEEFKDVIKYKPLDLSHWKKIHHIGDIHGCYDVLMEYLDGGLKDDELYIFVGDLLDRGIQNGQVLQFFIDNMNRDNIILLEGNHERWFWRWANDEEEEIYNRGFLSHTKHQLEAMNINKKDVRQLYRKFRQVAYYRYGNKTVIVTHGGLSKLPSNLMYIATDQFINGVGDYELDIDYTWEKNEGNIKVDGLFIPKNIYQIHGHRNIYRLPVQASKNSFNLEGQVEHGGHLRVVTLSDRGFETFEIKNNVYDVNLRKVFDVKEEDMTVEDLLNHMSEHDYIQEKELRDNISSFNFTRKAFRDKKWDELNIKARGLFINTKTKEIVSRSYNKFFNANERSFTKMSALADNLKFPVSVYLKENGYLGTVGYNSETDELVFTSKSEIDSEHAVWLKELFYERLSESNVSYVKSFLKTNNCSLVFEVIKAKDDPHIIEYEKDDLILLDIVRRSVVYSKLDYHELQSFGSITGLKIKKLTAEFDNWTDFYKWYREVTESFEIKHEGYVVEDMAGFMFKIKLPYYNFWKQVRGLKDKVAKKHEHLINTGSLYTPLHNKVFSWLKQQDKNWLRGKDVITIRNKFYEEVPNKTLD